MQIRETQDEVQHGDFLTTPGLKPNMSDVTGSDRALLAQMNRMEAWALSVERRSMELTRTNRSLRAASDKGKKEAEFFRAKAERQAELLTKAELARMDAERERACMEAKFTRTDKGTAMLKAARLKLELEACRERLAELESQHEKVGSTAVRDNPDHLSAIESLVMEGCELRLELESAQREHSSALTSVRAAADARVAAKDRELVSLQSELSSRRLLQQAAEDRTADLQKQVAALQQRLDDSHSAAQRAEAQSEGFRKEREAWAHEREELHRGLEAAQAASSEHLQKLLARDEHDRVLTQQLQLLELEVQRQRDATAHAQHEHQSKAEEVAEVKRELQGSQAKVEQQERELGGTHQKLRGLEEEFSRLQQESAALSQQKAEVDRLQGRHAEHAHIYRDQSAAQAQQIMGLSEQLRLAQQDCSAAHQRLHAKDGDLRELQAQHAELQQASRALQAELAAARDRLGVLEADLPMLQQDVLQLSSENTTLHIELEDCQAAAKQLREQLAATRQEAQRASQESKRQIRSLAAGKDELEHRAEALSAQLAAVQHDFEALSARVHQQDEENDQLQELHGARSDALGKHLDLMRAEKASLAAELAQARSECADMRAEIKHLHGRCTDAEASTDAISKASEEVRVALETDVESLRGQLDEASDRLQQMGALQAQVARLQEQCNQLQTEKSEAEIQLQARLNEMSAAHATALSMLNDRLDAASKSIACLEQQLRSGQGEIAEMEARVRALHHDLQVAQSEADSLRVDLAMSQSSEATLRSTLNETEGQVAAREEELCACQQRLAAKGEEVRDVRELLQGSLQPRIAMEPVPRLISLTSAALETGSVPDAQSLRQPVTLRSTVHAAQKAAPMPNPQTERDQVTEQDAAHVAPERMPGIARDPSLSTWQGSQAQDMAAEELHSSAAAQQQSPAGRSNNSKHVTDNVPELRVGRQGSLSPKKRPGSRREAAATAAGSSAQQKPRPAPLSIAADVGDIENTASLRELGTPFGQKQVLSRLQWSVQKSASPLGGQFLGTGPSSLRSAPSTPLSPTNASLAPTRRLPQPGRVETCMQSEDMKRQWGRSWSTEHPSVDSMIADTLGPPSARIAPRSPKLTAHGALMTCR